jgi:uncharacterized protein
MDDMRTSAAASSLLQDLKPRGGVVSLVLILAAAYLTVQVISGIKEFSYIGGGVPVSNMVTVSGDGEVFAVPDIATFTFSVREQAQTVAAAQEPATKKMNDLLAYLKNAGIEEKDIRTVGYNVYPRYDYKEVICTQYSCPPSGDPEIIGYEVSQSVEVKVRDTRKAGDVLSGVGEWGASDVSGLNFTVDEEDELYREARQKAIEDAQTKAKQLAEDLDVTLVRVVSFSESGGGAYPPIFYGYDKYGQGMMEADMSTPGIPPGENKLTAQVSITYELR